MNRTSTPRDATVAEKARWPPATSRRTRRRGEGYEHSSYGEGRTQEVMNNKAEGEVDAGGYDHGAAGRKRK